MTFLNLFKSVYTVRPLNVLSRDPGPPADVAPAFGESFSDGVPKTKFLKACLIDLAGGGFFSGTFSLGWLWSGFEFGGIVFCRGFPSTTGAAADDFCDSLLSRLLNVGGAVLCLVVSSAAGAAPTAASAAAFFALLSRLVKKFFPRGFSFDLSSTGSLAEVDFETACASTACAAGLSE